jgi:hypothetical protein
MADRTSAAADAQGGAEGAAMTPAITFFLDYAAQTKRECAMTLAVLAPVIRDTKAPTKDRLPWLKLARFGNAKTKHGSLRHDRNLIAISGIEADYDSEALGFDYAVEIAEKAGLLAIAYTSPSHTPERPRWRMLCPTSREYPPPDRARLLGRLNGLYRGIFARESWTLSQAYYYGAAGNGAHHRVELVDGLPIDRLDELDEIWQGPPGPTTSARTIGDGSEARDDAELIRRIVTGEGLHPEMCALAARYIGRGIAPSAVGDLLCGLMLAHPEGDRDTRWHDRYRSIPAVVSSATQKFAPECERRRGIARIVHNMARQRRSADQIKAAILIEAERLGFDAQSALTIGDWILRGYARRA